MRTMVQQLAKLRMMRALCTVVLCLILSIGVVPAQAQSVDPTPPDASAEAVHNTLNLLLQVLKDDASRNMLIQELEATVATTNDIAPAAEPATEVVSLGRQIAMFTQEMGQLAVSTLGEAWSNLSSGQSVFSGLSGDEFSILLQALPELFLVILITVSVFLLLRALSRRFDARLGRRAEQAGFFRTASLILVSTAIDIFVVALAWVIGYLATLLAVGEYGSIGIQQSMFLNAFLIVESGKVLIRAFLSPSAGGLRIVHVTDNAARTLNRSLGLIVGVMGYGQLLVVPLVNRSASMAAGSGVSALLSVFVLAFLVYTVIRRRDEVADWLSSPVDALRQTANEASDDAPGIEGRLGQRPDRRACKTVALDRAGVSGCDVPCGHDATRRSDAERFGRLR